MCTDEKDAYGSIKLLKKASGFPKRKFAYILHNKVSYTKNCHSTRHFKRLPAFAKQIIEISWIDLALMDKLSDSSKGVKSLLVCLDVFSRFVCVQTIKSKDPTDAVVAFKKVVA